MQVDENEQDEQMQLETVTVITNVPARTSVERASNALPGSIIDRPRKKTQVSCNVPGAYVASTFAKNKDHHPDWPLLMNPDDYMQEDYSIEDLESDCDRVRNYLNFCARKISRIQPIQYQFNHPQPCPYY